MITAKVSDHLDNLVPDGTSVRFSTTAGTFPNRHSTYTRTTTDGEATATLTLVSQADEAQVTATALDVSEATLIQVIHPGIAVQVTPDKTRIRKNQVVNYQYQVTNTGDTMLTHVTVIDDYGTPGNQADDKTVCTDITLAAEESTNCSYTRRIGQTTTSVATVTGQDIGDTSIHDSDETTVIVNEKIYLPITLAR
jgi:hypothetical protein